MIDRIPNVVVIPTRDHAETFCLDLVQQLLEQDECDRIVVFDNRDDGVIPDELRGHAKIVWSIAPRLTITQMWNRGWAFAHRWAADGFVNVAFLNDDIVIPAGFIGTLAEKLRGDSPCNLYLVCPDYNRPLEAGDSSKHDPTEPVRGTYREGGWCGWAFMLRGELLGDPLPPIDEQFKWWCGDDDLDRQIALHGGRCGIVRGLPLEHLGTATGRNYPELHELGWADMERFKKKYAR